MAKRILIDNLRHGANVIASDGEVVGKLHAVVVDPRDDEVTHIVVNAGPHFPAPGFGAPRLVSVAIEEMEGAEEGDVVLLRPRHWFEEQPEYVERDFLPHPSSEGPAEAEPEHRSVVQRVWDTGAALAAAIGNQLVGVPVPQEHLRRASFERGILNDTPVWRQEPHEQIGEVERVLTDNETDEIRALVIRRGHLFAEEVVLPIDYVTEILNGVVRVQLSDADIKKLERFEPPKE